MSYEAGSIECKRLIDAKESILLAMNALEHIKDTEKIKIQLKFIYQDLEDLHDIRRKIES